jgi:hypothetical protein
MNPQERGRFVIGRGRPLVRLSPILASSAVISFRMYVQLSMVVPFSGRAQQKGQGTQLYPAMGLLGSLV